VDLVSIILPLYKSKPYIEHTLNSILEQTYSDWELIVIDDGSPDDSSDVCLSVGDDRIRVYRRQNTGSCRARNFGINEAKGKFISFIDHDDLWRQTKLEKHVEHLERRPEVGVSYGPSELIDSANNSIGLFQIPKLSGVDSRDILCRTPIGNGSVPLLRREVLEDVKFTMERDGKSEVMFFDDECVGWEDVELWLRIACLTPWVIEGINYCLTLYRLVPDGIVGNPEKKQTGFERGLERVRRYAPELIAEHGDAARAYHLRYLARRLIESGDGQKARRYAHRAIRSFPGLILEDPGRTLSTLLASYALSALPAPMFKRLMSTAVKLSSPQQAREFDGS